MVLCDGGARIDVSNRNKYTMEDARIAFERAMSAHKW